MSDAQIDGDLRAALGISDRLGRLVEVAAIVAERIAPTRLVLVGGLAVSYWTPAQQPTDIDVLMPHTQRLDRIMHQLGFRRSEGQRHWNLGMSSIEIEAPGSHPGEHEQVIDVGTPLGRTVAVLSPADLAAWRVEEFIATGNAEVAAHIAGLWESERFDGDQLEAHLRYVGRETVFMEELTRLVGQWRADGLPSCDILHEQERALLALRHGPDGDMGTVRSRS